MTLRKAVEIVEENQKWRRSLPPYDGNMPVDIPHSPKDLGIALDCLISIAKDILKNYEANK